MLAPKTQRNLPRLSIYTQTRDRYNISISNHSNTLWLTIVPYRIVQCINVHKSVTHLMEACEILEAFVVGSCTLYR